MMDLALSLCLLSQNFHFSQSLKRLHTAFIPALKGQGFQHIPYKDIYKDIYMGFDDSYYHLATG